MPEDESQPPVNPDTPPAPADPVKGDSRQRKSELQELSELLQVTWKRAQPVLKQQSIALLRLTSQALATIANRLEHGPASPPSGMATPSAQPQPALRSTPTLPNLLERVQPQWKQARKVWFQGLGQIRARLPVKTNQKLSDRALSGIVAGALLLLLWITTSLFSGSPKAPTVANVPLAQRQAPTDLSAPAELNAPDTAEPVELAPPDITAPILPEPEPVAELPVVPPTPEPEPEPEPEPLPEVAPEPPPPPLELTPEQQLIAAIQDQVADVTNRYASGLIQSIQANFQSSRLSVNVGSGWYTLSADQQDKLAQELLRRSQELDFNRLTLKDERGNLLARNPVVGTEMVILKRQLG